MPRDQVLAALKSYKLTKVYPRSALLTADKNEWNVESSSKGQEYAGYLTFENGKLTSATRRLETAGPEAETLVNRLFMALFDNVPGPSEMEEHLNDGHLLGVTSTRAAMVGVTIKDLTMSSIGHMNRIIIFQVGGKQFRLTLSKSSDSPPAVLLEEDVLTSLPGQAKN